jgi:hypothetical protein
MFNVRSSVKFTGCAGLLLLAAALTACDSSDTSSAVGTTSMTAQAPTDSATLSWAAPTENTNGTPDTNLAGYHIYYGTEPNDLAQTIDVPGAANTTYVITGLSPGTYYFAVNAYNGLGVDSDLSNIESTTI